MLGRLAHGKNFCHRQISTGRENRERPGAERQHLYARSRQRGMGEVAHALKDVLARIKANQKAFSDSYRGTTSGDRLWRGLARLLADDPETMAVFDGLISSDDDNKQR